jgi:hypothetical protein
MRTKDLIQALLNGAYISKRQNRRKGFSYALYKSKGDIVEAISDIQFSTFKNVTKVNKGRITLNLNLVRQMHGKSLSKILYKQSRKKYTDNDHT